MSDGANLGITAKRALDTILGGAPAPTDEEWASPERVRARLEKAPLFTGTPPWEEGASGEGYSLVADAIGHAFLVLIEEDPVILEMCGPNMPEDALWAAMLARWPNADEWCGGPTGFQVGFALNAALYALGRPTGGNPAIVTIE